MNFLFIFNSMLLGAGLAMDAFSVSISNGMVEPDMGRRKRLLIAGTFSFFQFLMPVVGWFCVRSAAGFSANFHKCIPWIALVILLYIGGSMLAEGVRDRKSEVQKSRMEGSGLSGDRKKQGSQVIREKLTPGRLFIQGIATSIDAFSVGFTIVDYDMRAALTAALIIAVVTFVICYIGVRIGRLLGDIVGSRASIVGGIILILIGLEIFVGHFLG